MHRGGWLVWDFMKVYVLEMMAHLCQSSFPALCTQDSDEVEESQSHNCKCNDLQEVDVRGEALALVTKVQQSVVLVSCDF